MTATTSRTDDLTGPAGSVKGLGRGAGSVAQPRSELPERRAAQATVGAVSTSIRTEGAA